MLVTATHTIFPRLTLPNFSHHSHQVKQSTALGDRALAGGWGALDGRSPTLGVLRSHYEVTDLYETATMVHKFIVRFQPLAVLWLF